MEGFSKKKQKNVKIVVEFHQYNLFYVTSLSLARLEKYQSLIIIYTVDPEHTRVDEKAMLMTGPHDVKKNQKPSQREKIVRTTANEWPFHLHVGSNRNERASEANHKNGLCFIMHKHANKCNEKDSRSERRDETNRKKTSGRVFFVTKLLIVPLQA